MADHRIVVAGLGDSISYGMGDLGPGWIGPSWVGRFARQVGAARCVNLSHPGARIRGALRPQLTATTALRPTHALVSLGGNDLLRCGFDPVLIHRQMTEDLQRLVDVGPAVAVLGLPDPSVHERVPAWLRRTLVERVQAANEALSRAAERCGPRVIYIDLWDDPLPRAPEYWHVDRMHPNPIGHQHLADRARLALRLPQRRDPFPVSLEGAARPVVNRREWLLHEGLPWVLRRSIDVLPQMGLAVALHPLQRRRITGPTAACPGVTPFHADGPMVRSVPGT